MTESQIQQNLIKRVHPSIKNKFWTQFLEAVGQEIYLQRESRLKKLSMYDIDSLTEEEIINLASDMLGYKIDVSIYNDIDFIKKIFKAIPWLIVNKTLYTGYDFIFKSINKTGFIYLMYHSSQNNKLFRLIDKPKLLEEILYNYIDYTQPFVYFYPDKTTTVNLLKNNPSLDNEFLFQVDGETTFYLDDVGEKLTKHISLEYNLSEYEEIQGERYLFSKKYFDYLKYNGNYMRKSVEIPHYGCNLTIPIDFRTGFENYIPAMDMSVTVHDFKDSVIQDIVVRGVVEYSDGTERDIGFIQITDEEIFYYNEYLVITGLFKSRFSSKWFLYPEGYDTSMPFEESLDLPNLIQNKIHGVISFHGSPDIDIYDDGLGNIISNDNISGTVNYESSDIYLDFFKYNSKVIEVPVIGINEVFDTTFPLIKPDTVLLSFLSNGVRYNGVYDLGDGTFFSDILVGTVIDYETGIISFQNAYELIDVRMTFSCKEFLHPSFVPIKFWFDYMIEDTVKLKKINLFTDIFNSNKLLIEASFPYIEMSDLDQHISIQWLVRAPGMALDKLDIGKIIDNSPLLRIDNRRL